MARPNNAALSLTASVGPLLMLAAALLFSLLTVLVKCLGPEFTVWHIGFYRFFGGMLAIVALFGSRRNPYRGINIRLLILRGIVGSTAFIFVITAVRLLPISTAVVIFYTFPAFAAIFSWLLYGERVGWAGVACIAAVFVGVAIFFDFQLTGGIYGQTLALGGGALAGLTVTLIRTLRANNRPATIYVYLCTMGTLVTLPKYLSDPVVPQTLLVWAMILAIVAISVGGHLLMNQGFFYCKSWEGGVFMSSEVVFTAIIGIVFLGDPASLQFWIGGLVIIGSGLALNVLNAVHANRARAAQIT